MLGNPQANENTQAAFNFRVVLDLLTVQIERLQIPITLQLLRIRTGVTAGSTSEPIFQVGFDDPTGTVKVPRRPSPYFTVFKYI
jgi:hypothetical protein